MRASHIIFFTCLLAMLGGCGIKGPLYLPAPPPPAASQVPADDGNPVKEDRR